MMVQREFKQNKNQIFCELNREMDVEIGLGNAKMDELMKHLSIFRVGRGIGHVSNTTFGWKEH